MRSARLPDMRAESFICLPEGSGLRRLLDAACLSHGFTPRVEIEVTDPRDIPDYVMAGLGVALVATSIAQRQPPNTIGSTTLSQPTHAPIGLITTTHPSAAARAFATHLAD